MIHESIIVGLVLERRRIESEWVSSPQFGWRPVAVLPAAPEAEPWTPLGRGPSGERYYAGAQAVALYSTDTANYRDNLATGEPKLWVVLRADDGPFVDVVTVTADPAEGEAHTEAGTDVVETVEMPGPVAAAVAEFIAEHHVERPVLKRKRDRARLEVRSEPGPATPPGPGGHDHE